MEEKKFLTNWRPVTMLNCAYKVYAKASVLRLTNYMKEWIYKEQKGFIKERSIIDAITTIWEGMDMAKGIKQDFIFFKFDFEKSYDCLNWSFELYPTSTEADALWRVILQHGQTTSRECIY